VRAAIILAIAYFALTACSMKKVRMYPDADCQLIEVNGEKMRVCEE